MGSEGYGFVLPHVLCSQIEEHNLTGNVAGSCNIGFAFNNIGQSCQAFSWITAFSCGVGQIAGPPNTQTLKYDQFLLSDNVRGGTLKFGGIANHLNNTAFLTNSYITAISRVNCSECHPNNLCTNMIGFQLLTVSENGLTISDSFASNLDLINKP
jgi:hypothetical protein